MQAAPARIKPRNPTPSSSSSLWPSQFYWWSSLPRLSSYGQCANPKGRLAKLCLLPTRCTTQPPSADPKAAVWSQWVRKQPVDMRMFRYCKAPTAATRPDIWTSPQIAMCLRTPDIWMLLQTPTMDSMGLMKMRRIAELATAVNSRRSRLLKRFLAFQVPLVAFAMAGPLRAYTGARRS